MPPVPVHTKSSMERTGKEYREVHEWLDMDAERKAERHDITKIHEYGSQIEQQFGAEGRQEYIKTQQAKVTRALDMLEAEAHTLGALTTIGEITIGCALGYLDFRYPHEPWRPGHPKLEAWYEKVSALPPLARTVPPPA